MSKHADPKTAEATATALLKIEDITAENAPAIFGHNSLHRFVELARAEVVGEVPDLTTDKGRKRIASLAATVARSKTAVDAAGRAYLKQLKEMPKGIEAELREFIAAMDALRDEVRKPLNDYEAAELARKDAIEDAVQGIIDLSTVPEGATAAEIGQQRTDLRALIINIETYQERLEEAEEKRNYGILVLSAAFDKQKAAEEQAAELERLRKEAAERAEQDRLKAAADKAVEDERQRVAQEQQAQRDADAQRIQQAEQRAQQAEQDRIAADQRAENERKQSAQRAEQARLDEQQRQQDEAAEAARQQQEREANKAHRGAINKAALDALMSTNMAADGQPESFMSVTEAKAIIAAIVRGQIPAVSIAY